MFGIENGSEMFSKGITQGRNYGEMHMPCYKNYEVLFYQCIILFLYKMKLVIWYFDS